MVKPKNLSQKDAGLSVTYKQSIETNIFDYVRDLDEFERVWSFFPMDCSVATERGL